MDLISQNLELVIYGITIGFVCNWLLLKSAIWHGKWTADGATGIQKIHGGIVPRIGGVSVLLALFAISVISPNDSYLGLFLLLSLPAFFAGFIEDITKVIRPIYRLFACLFVGFLAWMNDIAIKTVDIWFVDIMLNYPIVSLLVTMLVVAALANAINMIDGLNGLSAGYVFAASSVLGVIAQSNNETALSIASFSVAVSIIGFLVFNWPLGRIFLGDGGAYMLGALLAILAISLAQASSAITQTTTLVILSYPAWEISLSMARRLFNRSSMTEPDHAHLHSLAYKYLRSFNSYHKNLTINSYAALLLICIMSIAMILPIIFVVVTKVSPVTNIWIVLMQFIFYSLLYKFFAQKCLQKHLR